MINTDLLRQQQKWKDILLEIRQIMTNLIQQVKEVNAYHCFRCHWLMLRGSMLWYRQ